jgi:hypothetical protein
MADSIGPLNMKLHITESELWEVKFRKKKKHAHAGASRYAKGLVDYTVFSMRHCTLNLYSGLAGPNRWHWDILFL